MTQHILFSFLIHILITVILFWRPFYHDLEKVPRRTSLNRIELVGIESLDRPTKASTPKNQTSKKRSVRKVQKAKNKSPQKKESEVNNRLQASDEAPTLTDKSQAATEKINNGPKGTYLSKARFSERLKAYIEQNKIYPRRALRMGHTGTVTLKMLIRADGHFEKIKILSSSNNSILDNSALKLLRKLDSFDPLPKHLGDKAEFIVPLAYKLDGGHY